VRTFSPAPAEALTPIPEEPPREAPVLALELAARPLICVVEWGPSLIVVDPTDAPALAAKPVLFPHEAEAFASADKALTNTDIPPLFELPLA